jgi:hypothetical protein
MAAAFGFFVGAFDWISQIFSWHFDTFIA